MAESISEGTLKSWLKQPGDFVNADEEIATIETDKASTLVLAPCSSDLVGRRVTCDTATYRASSPPRVRYMGGLYILLPIWSSEGIVPSRRTKR